MTAITSGATSGRKLLLFVLLGLGLVVMPFVVNAIGGNYWLRVVNFALLYCMLALGLNIVVGFAGLLDLGYVAFYAVGAYMVALLTSPHLYRNAQAALETLPADGPGIWMWIVSALFVAILFCWWRFAFGKHGRRAELLSNALVVISMVFAAMLIPHVLRSIFEVAQHYPGDPGNPNSAGFHMSIWVIVPLGALLAALFGVLLGTPVLKLRGDYLAIVTLGFGEIIRIFMNNLDRPVNITNGPQGIKAIDPISIFGFDLSQAHMIGDFKLTSNFQYYYLFLVLVVIIVIACYRLQHSRIGRAWVALREDEIAAKAMGINTRNVKLLAFALGASFGGVSGAMFGAYQGFVSPESFVLWESIVLVAMVVLGGMGHIPGVILGAVLLQAFPEFLRATMEPLQHMLFGKVILESEVIRQLMFGLAMVLIMLYRPAGLWPAPKKEDQPVTEEPKPLSPTV